MFLLSLAISLAPQPVPAAPLPAQTGKAFVLQAEHVHTGSGKTLSPGQVLVRDGKVAGVGATVDAGELPVIELKGHLSAGIVALGETSLLGDQGADTTRFLMPEGEARLGFDPRQPALHRLVQEGITTVVLTPPSHSLVAGKGLMAKTGNGRILAVSGPLHVAFDASMFQDRPDPSDGASFGGGFFAFFGPNGRVNPNGFKSSYPGAAELLEESIKDSKSRVSELASGKAHAWLRTRTRAEASRALAFATRHKVDGVLESGSRIGELASEVKASGLGVALGMFRETNQHHSTKSAVALSEAGVPFGFVMNAKARHAASLRMAAALCRRAGMSSEACWAALTSGAAKAIGLDKQVGQIATGLDADLVHWDGDPAELSSRVQSVWVDGVAVPGVQPAAKPSQGNQ